MEKKSTRTRYLKLALVLLFLFALAPGAMMVPAASGDFSIDFVAAAPQSYNHLTGGGAYDDRTIGVDSDVVESLEGGDFACGDIATFFAAVTVDNTQTAIDDGPQTVEMDFSFLMDTTGQSGVAIGDIVLVQVNYDPIEDLIGGEDTVDQGIIDDGGSVATLIDEYTTGPLFTAGSELWGTVELTDLEAGEQVVVRLDVKLFCDPGSNPTGNLQAALEAARLTSINGTTPVSPPEAIPGGAQTIPWKQIGKLGAPALEVEKTVTIVDGDCATDAVESLTITSGDTVKYCYVVTNTGTAPLYDMTLVDDNGTPADTGDDFTVALSGLTDVDGIDGLADDLAAGASATGEALVTIEGPAAGESDQTIVNTGTAQGFDAVLYPGDAYTAADTATVIVQPPPVVAPQTRVIKGNADGNDTVATLDEPGGSVTINVEVYNDAPTPTGDATLTVLTDDIYGDITTAGHDGITATTCETGGVIVGGGSYICSFTVAVSAEPADSPIVDTVTATLFNEAATVSDTDQANVVINDVAPTVTLVKSAEPGTLFEPGGDFVFTLDITNTSAEAVTITDLTDTQSGTTDFSACTALIGTTLAAGASTSCQYTVSHTTVGSYDNTAAVTVEDNDGTTASASDDETVRVTDVQPTVSLTKEASPLSLDEPGGDFLFTLTIVNTSVEEVTIDSLVDSQSADATGFSACSALVGTTLAAGASTLCTYTVNHTMPGSYDNTATVTVSDDDNNSASDTDTATVTVNDVPSAISMVKTADPTVVTEPGGDVLFTFTVTNDSAVDSVTIDSLTDTVYGDLTLVAGSTCSLPQIIAPGGSYSCSFTAFVSADETNVATASGLDDDGNPVSASDDATVTVNDSFTNIVVTKTADPTSVDEPGGEVTFGVTVDNPSAIDAVTIDTLVDDIHGNLDGQGDCSVPQLIAPNGSYSCSFTAIVSGNAGDSETDTVTASGVDEDGVPVSDDDSATVTVADVDPVISVDKTASPISVDEPGGDVTFTVIVSNDGVSSDPVTIDSLVDDVHGDLNGQGDCAVPQIIAAGASYTCAFTAFVSGNAGYIETDTVTASGSDDEGNPVSASDDATVTIADVPASILTTKTANPTSVPETGGDVTFTITVENTSAVDDVTISSVVDSEFGDVSASCVPTLPATLAPGETVVCSFVEFISGNAGEIHNNVAIASGEDDDGNPVEDDDEEDVPFDDVLPDISVTKTADVTSVPETGGNVIFTFVATNNSLEAATLDSMIDDTFGDLNGQGDCVLPQSLAPAGQVGDAYTCAITVFLSGDDLQAHTNIVTATASDDEGNTDTDSDDETVTFEDVAPVIQMTKSASPTSVPETGGDVTFTFLVENIGQEDVTLTSLSDTVFGDLNGQGDCATGGLIPIGGSYTCSITVFLAADDLAPHSNVVTAVGTDDDGTTDEDSDDETVTFEDLLPDVSITKTANPTSVAEPGANVLFTIVVRNIGPEAVTIDSLVDTDFDLATNCAFAIGLTLNPGDSLTCSFIAFVAGDVGEDHQNTATVVASDNDGNSDTESDTADVVIENTAPAISIVKDGEATINEGGDTATYSFLITNNSVETDPVTITSLTDDKFGDLLAEAEAANGGNPIVLNPGESFSFSIDRDLTLDGGESHTNVVTVVATDDEGDTATDNDNHVVTGENVAPVIDIVKDGEATINEGDDTATYSFLITNNSVEIDPVTITSLTDDKFGDLLAEAEAANNGNPIVLNPGESFSFSIDRDLTLDAGESHTNVVTVEATDDEGDTATDDDDHTVTGANVDPVIAVTKTVDQAQVFAPGEDVTFTVLVENNSVSTDPVTIDSLTDDIHGDLNGQGNCSVPQTIEPGGSYTCAFTVLVDGDETDTVTASGTDDEGTPVSDSDSATVDMINPSLAVEKSTNGQDADTPYGAFVTEGDTVTWEYVVTNDGDVTLTNISVTDDQLAATAIDCGDGSNVIADLAAGASATCTASGTAMLGQYANLGAASTSYTDGDGDTKAVRDSDPSHYYGLQAGQPSIQINSLTAQWETERTVLTGQFNITDESEGGNRPDGFLIGLEYYDVDWEYKKGRRDEFEAYDPNGSAGGWLLINGTKVNYNCSYRLLDIDGDTSVARDLAPGEQIVFDESVNIGYTCTFDSPIPSNGILRGTASAGIFGRTDNNGAPTIYFYSQEFELGGRRGL